MLEKMSTVFFHSVAMLMRFAPVGAFGAMAFTIGEYGVESLANLGQLIATFYLTSLFFVLVVLGTMARLAGLSILRLTAYLQAVLLLVPGTSPSEAASTRLTKELKKRGSARTGVGTGVAPGRRP